MTDCFNIDATLHRIFSLKHIEETIVLLVSQWLMLIAELTEIEEKMENSWWRLAEYEKNVQHGP